jgi:hypothetical protein
MDDWELNPEGLGSLWLMAPATWVENILSEGLHERGRQAKPLLNYALAFVLQLRKSTENLSQGSQVVRYYSLHRFHCLLGAALTDLLSVWPPWLPMGDFSQPLVSTNAFQVAELRGSLHQLNLS